MQTIRALRRRTLLLFAGAWLCLPDAAAAGSEIGFVTTIFVRDDGLHWVELSGNHSGRPGCAASHEYWIIRDENSTYGKDQFAMLLTAYTSGKQVGINGGDACTRWNDGEDIREISFQ